MILIDVQKQQKPAQVFAVQTSLIIVKILRIILTAVPLIASLRRILIRSIVDLTEILTCILPFIFLYNTPSAILAPCLSNIEIYDRKGMKCQTYIKTQVAIDILLKYSQQVWQFVSPGCFYQIRCNINYNSSANEIIIHMSDPLPYIGYNQNRAFSSCTISIIGTKYTSGLEL